MRGYSPQLWALCCVDLVQKLLVESGCRMSQRRDDFCSYSERSAMAVRLELPRKMAPNPIDQYVGSRGGMAPKMLGMSQEKLGGALRLTFQQVQKYERGANRIGASRLQQMSHILQVSIEFFFEGAPNASAPHGSNGSTLSMAEINNFISDPDGLRLIGAFMRIDNAALR